MDNVNNLNGVPNFGHGFEEEEVKETETPVEETDEVEISNQEEVE